MSRRLRLLLACSFVVGFLGGNCARTFAAEWINGNVLLVSIKSEDKIEHALALGYIMGVHDRSETVSSCTPPGVTPLQVSQLFIQYSEAHPEYMHYSADRIIGTILKKNFPCVDADTVREGDENTVY